jgi:hypothetical protein
MLCLNGRSSRGGTPLRVQQVNQYMSVMEVFEHVGRKFAIRDKVDHTQRFKGTGYQRRERETRRTEPLSDQDTGTPAPEMDAWVPETEEEDHNGQNDRPSPGRRSRSAQRSSTSPRRDTPASPGPVAPASIRGAQAESAEGQRMAAQEGAAPTRNVGGRSTNEQGTQLQSKVPKNPPLSAPVGGGNGQRFGGMTGAQWEIAKANNASKSYGFNKGKMQGKGVRGYPKGGNNVEEEMDKWEGKITRVS